MPVFAATYCMDNSTKSDDRLPNECQRVEARWMSIYAHGDQGPLTEQDFRELEARMMREIVLHELQDPLPPQVQSTNPQDPSQASGPKPLEGDRAAGG